MVCFVVLIVCVLLFGEVGYVNYVIVLLVLVGVVCPFLLFIELLLKLACYLLCCIVF